MESCTGDLAALNELLDWRSLLAVVQPDTAHPVAPPWGWRFLWWWKSRPATRFPVDVHRLSVSIAQPNHHLQFDRWTAIWHDYYAI